MSKTISGIILALLLVALPGIAAQLKIAHVDSKIVFDGYKETKTAQKEYDSQVSKWEQEAAQMQKDLTEMKERLDKQSLMLSAEKKKELEAKFLQKQTEYQQFVQKIYGREGDLFKKNEEFSGPIIKKIKKVIQEVAKQEGYDLVLDRASGSVVYWKPDNDLTQKVLDVLNQ
ncbi:MAG: OmpH family outer membrane protein [Fibrobacteria bacterium]|nr:OmpH family outer membrane protein [Fibrobacteria bacterium]